MEIGKKLKSARSKAGLTQEAVANEIHVSRQTISNWENEKSYPDIVNIIILSDLYRVSLDELLKGDDDMIKHLEDSTNVVKSSQKLTLGMILWFILITAVLIVDKFFYKIPRVHGLWPNIIVMTLFFVGVIWQFFSHMKILKYVDGHKPYVVESIMSVFSNYKIKKSLYLVLFILLYIVSIILVFYIIESKVDKLWLDIILRGIFALALYYLVNCGYKLAVKRLNSAIFKEGCNKQDKS